MGRAGMRIVVGTALMAACLSAAPGAWAGVFDQQQTSENGNVEVWGAEKRAQSFKPGFNYANPSSVLVYVYRVGSPSLDLVVQLCADDGGKPGTVLDGTSFSPGQIPTTPTWKEIPIFADLQQDVTYWIVLSHASNGGDGSNFYAWKWWHDGSADKYTRGQAARYQNSAWSVPFPLADLTFRSWADPVPCSTPGTPGAPTYSNVSTTGVTLNWADVANEVGYQVQRAPAPGASCGAFTNLGSQLGANATGYTDNSVAANTNYCYRVVAKAGAGCVDQTGASSQVTTTACTNVPGVPSTPVFTGVSTSTVTVRWTDVANEVGYQVQRASSSGGTCGSFANLGSQLAADTTSFADSGLTASTGYCYRVVAKGASGCGDRTGLTGTVTTACGGPSAPPPASAQETPEKRGDAPRPSVAPYVLEHLPQSGHEPERWRDAERGEELRLFKDMYFDAGITEVAKGTFLYAFRNDVPALTRGDLLWHGGYDTVITVHRILDVRAVDGRTLEVSTQLVEPKELLRNVHFDLQEHLRGEPVPVFEMVEYPDGRVEKWTSDQRLLAVSKDPALRPVWGKPSRVEAEGFGGSETLDLPLINESNKTLFNGQDVANYSRDAYGNPINLACAGGLTVTAKEIRLAYTPTLAFTFDTVGTTLQNANVELNGTLDFKTLLHVNATSSCNLLYRARPWRYTRPFFVWVVPMTAYLEVYPVVEAAAGASGYVQAGAQRQITHQIGYSYDQVSGWQGYRCPNGSWICSDTGFAPYNPGDPAGLNRPTWSFTGHGTAELRLEPHAGVYVGGFMGPRVIPTPSLRLSGSFTGAYDAANYPGSTTYNYGLYGCFNAKFEFTLRGIFDNCSNSNGVSAEYYAGTNLEGSPIITRTDPQPSASSSTMSSNSSVRWTGMVEPRYSEAYTFTANANDGVRLWVDDQSLSDDWNPGALRERTASFNAQAGQKYNLKMEYFAGASTTPNAALYWTSPRQCKEMVPQGRFYPCGPFYTKTLYDNCWLLLARKDGADGLPGDNNLDPGQGPVVVGVPQLVSPAAGAYAGTLRPTFTWTAAANADRYEIMIGNDVFETTATTFAPPRDLFPAVRAVWKVRGIATARARRGLWSEERRIDVGYTVYTGTSYYGKLDVGNQVVVYDTKKGTNLTFRLYDIDSSTAPRQVLVKVYDGPTLFTDMVVRYEETVELGSGSGLLIYAPNIFDSVAGRFAELMIAPTFVPELTILEPQGGTMESATVRVAANYVGKGVEWVDVGSPPRATSTMKTICYNGACTTAEQYAWTMGPPEGEKTMTVTLTDLLGRSITRTVTVRYVPCSSPGTPAAPTFSNLTQSSVRLSWADVTGDWGYTVQRSPAGCASWANVSGQLSLDATGFTDTGLSENTTYCYRVIALSCSGTDATGSPASVTTPSDLIFANGFDTGRWPRP